MKSVLRWAAWSAAAGLLAGCGGKDHGDKDAQPQVAVSVAAVRRADIGDWVEAYGVVDAQPDRSGQTAVARLAAPFESLVLDVPVKEGQRVKAGTVIVRLDDRAAAASMRSAEASAKAAGAEAERQRGLEALGGVSKKSLEDADQKAAGATAAVTAARAQLSLTRLPTPVGGVVAKIRVLPGQSVAAGAPLADIVDAARLSVTVNVPAEEAARVRAGQPAELLVRSAAAPIKAVVAFVSPEVDPATGAVLVRLAPAGAGDLRLGDFIKARILTELRRDRLVVPEAAVYTDHDGHSTLSVVHGAVADLLEVKPGLRSDGVVEVDTPSLKIGDRVVTTGAYALRDRTRVSITGTETAPSREGR